MFDTQKVEFKGMTMAVESKQKAVELVVKGRRGGKDLSSRSVGGLAKPQSS